MQRAGELGQSIIALTDRDGLYAAVRWARECSRLGLRPVLGVDIAVEATEPARVHPNFAAPVTRGTPARGGAWIDESKPRVVLLAAERAAGDRYVDWSVPRIPVGTRFAVNHGCRGQRCGNITKASSSFSVLIPKRGGIWRKIDLRSPKLPPGHGAQYSIAIWRSVSRRIGNRVFLRTAGIVTP